jgi:hypothetical protein
MDTHTHTNRAGGTRTSTILSIDVVRKTEHLPSSVNIQCVSSFFRERSILTWLNNCIRRHSDFGVAHTTEDTQSNKMTADTAFMLWQRVSSKRVGGSPRVALGDLKPFEHVEASFGVFGTAEVDWTMEILNSNGISFERR